MSRNRSEVGAAEEDMVGLEEAAAVLGVSRSTFQRMLRQGNIRGAKVGRQWRFRRVDLQKFSQMAHPSAAGVKVVELDALTASVSGRADVGDEVHFESTPPGQPATEEEAAVDRLLQTLLAIAVRDRASDIHIEPARSGSDVRLRVDGVLHRVMELPRYAHRPLAACIKQHAGLPLDQELAAQDGRFRFTYGGTECDARVATLPSVHGESLVMRLLPRVGELLTLDSPLLGMCEADLDRFKRLLRAPCGVILIAGPSGCGKTTLLYAALQYIASPEIKTITIEDPVEFAFPWATQAAVNVKAGFTFESAMRAAFRHDPDVIMVGEMRTLPVAELAARYAITGHLVMSVLHASNAPGAIWRLLDMGLAPFELAESLVCIVSMRLMRKVCDQCRAPDQPSYAALSPLVESAKVGGYQLPDNPSFVRGSGCDACCGTGYWSRRGVYEVMEINPELQRLIAARAPAEALREVAVRNGMTTLAADGLRKAAEGITTVGEVARVVPQESG